MPQYHYTRNGTVAYLHAANIKENKKKLARHMALMFKPGSTMVKRTIESMTKLTFTKANRSNCYLNQDGREEVGDGV